MQRQRATSTNRNTARSRAEPAITVHVQPMRLESAVSIGKTRVPNTFFASVRQLESVQKRPSMSTITAVAAPETSRNVTTVNIKKRQVAAVRRASVMDRLPNELLITVLAQFGITELLQLRGVNRRFRALAEDALLARFTEKMSYHSGHLSGLNEKLTELRNDTRPRLQHYRQFLQDTAIADVKEVCWYTTVPQELKTVCACLAVLKDGNVSEATSWAEIKKLFGRQDFKGWYAALRENVEKIPLENLKAVERIIMYDPLITYERLREVSMIGYRILIVVAAALQFGLIHTEIRKQKVEIHTHENQLRICEYYVDCITSNLVKNCSLSR